MTGIAGPGGGTPEKPVGTVAIAVAAGERLSVRTFKFFGNREMVKFQSAQAALNMLRLMLQRRLICRVGRRMRSSSSSRISPQSTVDSRRLTVDGVDS